MSAFESSQVLNGEWLEAPGLWLGEIGHLP
jgi:hypothetical protein